MGQQIIQQPDGRYAVFSSITDTFVVWDATPEEIIEWRVEQATEKAREDTQRELEQIQDPTNSRPYFHFTMTWDEALELHREHGGEEIL